jgi:response regulator RpfG family c-di-GMP phosphodiesterase
MTFNLSVEFVLQTCCNTSCGISFGVPDEWDKRQREKHTTFYCPNGHSQRYLHETEAERLDKIVAERDRQLSARQARIDQLKADAQRAQREIAAQKGVATKLRKRAVAGVCPCCQRTFSALARHMKCKHPEYVEQP